MKLELERLELAFQFLFLLDSSGPTAVQEAASIILQRLDARRSALSQRLETWSSSATNQSGGVHGDSDAFVADLGGRLCDSLRSTIKRVFEFEPDRGAKAGGKSFDEDGGFEDWEVPVKDAFSRCLRDRLTPGAAREAMEPLRRCVAEVFEEAEATVSHAVEMAREAMARAPETDRATAALAPTWPAHRQAATDRAILRLGRSEMIAGRSPPKWVVHHGVNLAKRYSTEKSPAFVNALLDKIMKQVAAHAAVEAAGSASIEEPRLSDTDGPADPAT